MAYTFMKAQGYEVGGSLLEEDKIPLAKDLIERAGDRLVLPVDFVVADAFDNDANTDVVDVDGIPADWQSIEVGPKNVDYYAEQVAVTKNIIWNGSMGVF